VQKCAHTKKNNHINPSISPYKPVCAKNHADFRRQRPFLYVKPDNSRERRVRNRN